MCHSMRMIVPVVGWILAVVPPASGEVWNEQRKLAIVRFEIPEHGNLEPNVGTGVMVRGLQGKTYVLTSTHVLTPGIPPDAVPPGWVQLPPGSTVREGSSGGAPLEVRRVRHLGQDVSLVELKPRQRPQYTRLPVAALEMSVGQQVFLAGFPLGADSPDTSRSGKVTSLEGLEDNVVTTDILTAKGMSDGPYILDYGTVVGFHLGGAKYTAGFAQMRPISAVRPLLEYFLPRIPIEIEPLKDISEYLTDIQSAELRGLHIDDLLNVSVNSTPIITEARYGAIIDWRSFHQYLKPGRNEIRVFVRNGVYGGCGAELQFRINGTSIGSLKRSWLIPIEKATVEGVCVDEEIVWNFK
jgi:hypothetical protein